MRRLIHSALSFIILTERLPMKLGFFVLPRKNGAYLLGIELALHWHNTLNCQQLPPIKFGKIFPYQLIFG